MSVTVRVPATSANLGPGFDSLGLALGLYDEVRARRTDDGTLSVVVEGEGQGVVPLDEEHLVVRAMRRASDRLSASLSGLAVYCRNRIPHGRGLGSSAGAIVAGILAARALAPEAAPEMDDDVVLQLAAEVEGHPDNVAACLLGGLTVAWDDRGVARAARLVTSTRLVARVFVPPQPLSTLTARGLLPEEVPHRDAAHTAGRAALLVEALTRRPDLLFPATEDRLHQDYRAAAMPETAALVRRLRAGGVAAVVSGAGPSVLALSTSHEEDGEADEVEVASELPAGWALHTLRLDADGAQVSAETLDAAG